MHPRMAPSGAVLFDAGARHLHGELVGGVIVRIGRDRPLVEDMSVDVGVDRQEGSGANEADQGDAAGGGIAGAERGRPG